MKRVTEWLLIISGGLLIYQLFNHAGVIINHFQHFLSLLSPFIMVLVLAYLLNRPVDQIEIGIVGMFLSVPVAALISMMVEDYLVFKEKRKSQLTSSK